MMHIMKDFRDVVDIFHQLKATSGRNDKESILRANRGNELFKEVLNFLYNPFVLTGIKAKKLKKFSHYIEPIEVWQFNNIIEAMEFVKEYNTGRDIDVKTIANFINTYDTDSTSPVHDFLQDMFTKDFKCGITASTINKVFGKGFIPKFDVMLAKSWKDEEHKVNGNFIVTEKLDGIRCLIMKENGKVKMFSRQGKPIEGLVQIEDDLLSIDHDNFVLDGELLNTPDPLSFDVKSDELFRQTQKRVRKDGIKKDVDFHAFDYLPLDEFKGGKSKLKTLSRKESLSDMINTLEFKHIKDVPILYHGDDKTEVMNLLRQAVDGGKEGVMVNLANGFYVTKRSNTLLKVKEMHTLDLRIIGFERGEGKYSNTLGRINVNYKGRPLGVGSGFTDSERNWFWEKRYELNGEIIEVQYFEESKNQDGEESLRFPIYVRLRDDKDEISYF